MLVFDTYSKRLKKSEQGTTREVYKYDYLPEPFRVQVIHIWRSAIGAFVEPSPFGWEDDHPISNSYWTLIHNTLIRERGVFKLADGSNPAVRCRRYLMEQSVDGALDIIELSFRLIDRVARNLEAYEKENAGITQDADDAIRELNYRFNEHHIGYQFIEGEIVRVDSQYIHAEAVKPAFSLLNDLGFKGPSEEFLKAHEFYRKGDSKEAINWALKAFESTMKSICDARKWPYPASATAKPLVEMLFVKGLIPQPMQNHFAALRSTLEAGLPTLRNKTSGHGQGAIPTIVPDYMAAYALHLSATNIVFLVEAHKGQP
jgi:hypothetical protein